MSQFSIPMANPVTAGDIIAAIKGDLDATYRDPLGFFIGLAETEADVFPMLATAGNAAAILLTWQGDESAESASPITRGVVLNTLNVLLKQRSPPTAVAHETMISAGTERDSFIQTISNLRKRLLAYRFMINDTLAFDDDARGPVYSRLRYYGVKPYIAGRTPTDAFTMNFKFYSPIDMPSFDEGDPDKIALQITQVGKKQT